MKEILKTKVIKATPYPFNVNFCLVQGEPKGMLESELGRTIRDNFEVYIYLRKGEITLPIVVHEIFHATEFIMNAIGQKIDKENPNEAWAYLLEHLTREFLKFNWK